MTALPAAAYFNGAITNQNAKDAQDAVLAFIREMLGGDDRESKTISGGGSITPTKASVLVDTNGGAGTDDLDNIDQTNHPAGRFILLRSTDAARTVVVRHNQGSTGKILLVDSANLSLTTPSMFLLLQRIGTTWEEVLRGYGTNTAALRTFLAIPGLAVNNVFTGTQTLADGGDVATNGGSITLPAGNLFNLTGTSNVTGFASKGVGTPILVRHNAAHLLVNSGSFVLLTGANITTAAGDHSIWRERSAGWFMVGYSRADGTALAAASSAGVETGAMMPYGGEDLPSGYLWVDGADESRATYATLYGKICKTLGAFTVTIATPAVFTLTGHNRRTGARVRLFTTGALPTGLSANTDYYVINTGANTGNLATSRANAMAGTAIATSGSQSGTHTMQAFPYGAGNGSTTFTKPDKRGVVSAGVDHMGTAAGAAGRITFAISGVAAEVAGEIGGAQKINLTTGQLPAAGVGIPASNSGAGSANTATFSGKTQTNTVTSANLGTGDNVIILQPTGFDNWIIKT